MPASPPVEDMSPRLDWSEDGAPRSGRFGDVYFSREDGLAETRSVFLEGCGLPDAWAGRSRFTVAELGFGTGLNIAALLDLWAGTAPPDGRLHIFSVEAFPLTADEASRALSAWPELGRFARALTDAWPHRTPGFHRLELPELRAVLDLAVGDAAWALEQWSGQADAWFLDGFAPSANPQMWSGAVLDGVAARSAPGARVATFTVAGAVRRGLAERGFAVERKPGHGRKRQRLEARLADAAPQPPAPGRVAVIGAGVAGAMLARALTALGAPTVVIERQATGAGASGFPGALVTPRLDAGDEAIAALNAQALARAGSIYRAVDGAVLAEGVLQLEQTPRDAGRFAKVAAQPWWAGRVMTVLDPDAVADRLGEAGGGTGLMMGGGLAIAPRPILEAGLGAAERVEGEAATLSHDDAGAVWVVRDGEGRVLAEAEAVVIAAGWGASALAPSLPLTPVRGQADWVEGVAAPPVAWGGYAVPTPDGLLFGATHERGQTAMEASEAASTRNRETLAGRLPELARRIAAAGAPSRRVAIRATTPDRLPLAGALSGHSGLFVLTGLGSRGFCHAPLLAEHVAALVVGAASPLPAGPPGGSIQPVSTAPPVR